jgi:hypothetical protein
MARLVLRLPEVHGGDDAEPDALGSQKRNLFGPELANERCVQAG